MNYQRFFEEAIDQLHAERRYRVFADLERIVGAFPKAVWRAEGEARDLVVFFCVFAAGSFLFNGALFVANAAFNNLGFATYSTLFNWGRSTLGIIPFVWAGAQLYGAKGVIAGWGLGAIVFGVAAAIVAFRVVRTIGDDPPAGPGAPPPPPAANSPFSTGKAATLQ